MGSEAERADGELIWPNPSCRKLCRMLTGAGDTRPQFIKGLSRTAFGKLWLECSVDGLRFAALLVRCEIHKTFRPKKDKLFKNQGPQMRYFEVCSLVST